MTFSSTQTAHIAYCCLGMNFDCCGTVKQKVVKMQQRKQLQRHVQFQARQSPLFLLNQFNKTYLKLIVSKLVYWPVWIAIVDQESSKGIILTCMSIPLDLLTCNLPVPLNLPCTFHITALSAKCMGLQINTKNINIPYPLWESFKSSIKNTPLAEASEPGMLGVL